MNVLSVEELTKSFGDRTLFKNLTFGIDQGDKVAIVAKNGAGKSTLLSCLYGKEPADSGRVVFRNDITVAYMQQAENLDEKLTLYDAVFDSPNESMQLIKLYNQAFQKEDNREIERLSHLLTEKNLWDFESQVQKVLSVLKLTDFQLPVSSLSGGQKKRIALAQVLLSDANLLFLDEPTNHLDLDMIEWLEDHLSKSQSTLVMVTHDRYFLEVVCNQIYELEDQTLYRYKGNFSYYLEKKAEREAQTSATVSKAKNQFRKELEWIRRQPKARGTKQKARIEAFHETKKVASQRLEEDELELPVKMERLGTKIVEFHKVGKSYGDKVILQNMSYNFQRQERLGIVGANGSGKSTFLKMVVGELAPDSGKVVHGETVQFGYFDQANLAVDNDKKVIDIVKDIAEFIPLEKGRMLSAAQLLEKFLFPRDMHYQYAYKLSGGERRRLKLLTVLIQNPNFLILDEPTNDLDIFVLSVLEDYLKNFGGCLIVVSHDRYFMDKMVDHLFVFEGQGKVKDITGNYTTYRALEKEQAQDRKKETEIKVVEESKQKSTTATNKLSFKEKQELKDLEKELERLEAEKDRHTATLSDSSASNDALMEAGNLLTEIMQAIDQKTDRWLELQEREN